MAVRAAPAPGAPSALGLTGASTAAEVAETVFAAMQRVVPFVFACLATTDPENGLINGAFKSHPLDVGDEEFAAAEYGGPDVNLLSEIARRPVPVGVLSVDTAGAVDSCRRLREFMTPRFGFTDELRLVCRSHGTTWGALALYRGPQDPPFTRTDGAVVAAGGEAVALALRRTLVRRASSQSPTAGRTVLIVDHLDRLTGTSVAAEQAIEALGGWDHGSLPATVLAVTATARTTSSPTESRVRTRSGDWVSIRAVPVVGRAGAPSVVLTLEAAPSAAVGRIELAARGLTAREMDVVDQVLRGASTKQMAEALHLSPHTVQDHLKTVFAKTEVRSRRELIARFID